MLMKDLLAIVVAAMFVASAAHAELIETGFKTAAAIIALVACIVMGVVLLTRLLRRPPDAMQLAQDRQEARKPPRIPGRRGERFADHDDYIDWVKRRGRWAGKAKRST